MEIVRFFYHIQLPLRFKINYKLENWLTMISKQGWEIIKNNDRLLTVINFALKEKIFNKKFEHLCIKIFSRP